MVVLHYSFPIFWRKIKFISHLEVKRQIFWFCVVKFAMDSSSIIWNNLNIYQAPPLQIDLQFCNFKSSKTKTMALPKSSRLRKKSTKCQVTIQRNIIMNLWNFKQTSVQLLSKPRCKTHRPSVHPRRARAHVQINSAS